MKSGVTATDNFDGNVTSKITVNLDDVDINTVGEKSVFLEVTDKAGNTARLERKVIFSMAYDSGIIKDPSFDNEWDTDQWYMNGGGNEVTIYNQDGHMVVDIVNPGGWDSATSPALGNLTTDDFNVPGYYLFTFKVKADKNRLMMVRGGLDLGEEPWIENFEGTDNATFQITTEWVTHYLVFHIPSKTSSKGLNAFKFELKVGSITWGDEEKNNKVYFDDVQFYFLTTKDEEPVVERVPSQKTSFLKGSELPDLTKLITINDREDGVIPVTAEMITHSIDMNKAGTYDVVYTIKDSSGNEVSYTIQIKVVEEADTVAPTITVNDDLPTIFDQFDDVTVNLADYISIIDDVDGEIAVEDWMIDPGTFDLSVAGVHQVTFTVRDAFGNEATKTITFTVNDKEAPVISGATDKKIKVGTPFDSFEGVTVKDNLDGDIELTEEHISGTVDINVTGIYTITYTVVDEAGNVTTVQRKIEVVSAKNIVYDEENATELLDIEKEVEDNGGQATTEVVDGNLIVNIGHAGEWDSYVKLKYSGEELPLEYGKNYKIVIVAKAEKSRRIGIKLGKGLDTEPWFDIYEGLEAGGNHFVLTNEFKTFEFEFTVNVDGSPVLEVLLGAIDYAQDESNNKVTFESIRIVPEKIIEYDEENAIDLLDLNKAAENAEATYTDAQVVVTVSNPGEWASFSKLKFSGEELPLVEGKGYKIVISAKVETPRKIGFKLGQGLDQDPWILPYEGLEADGNIFELTTEVQTFEYRFTVNGGNPVLEVWFGYIDGTNETDSVITIQTLKIVPEKE